MCVCESLLPGGPLYGLDQTVEDERGRLRSEGEDSVEKVLPLTFHVQQVVV